jgi:3-hydroxymyristoyl/3-hydroxydecanoyl-(acyl carrier protein) dehydratase
MYVFPIVETTRTSDGIECRVDIPDDCPFFEGHFPGRPVLPAVVQLVLVAQVYRDLCDAAASISRVERFRLYRPIGAGERISVTLAAAGEMRSRFVIGGPEGIAGRGLATWTAGDS